MDMAKSRVLIVDDAKFMRLTLSNIFSKNNFDIIGLAENGEEAIELYKEHKPDIVTLDVTMPIIDGIEALKQIIKFDENAKVIMCSAMGQQKLVVEAIEQGAKDFIVKPFDEKRVINTVNQILEDVAKDIVQEKAIDQLSQESTDEKAEQLMTSDHAEQSSPSASNEKRPSRQQAISKTEAEVGATIERPTTRQRERQPVSKQRAMTHAQPKRQAASNEQREHAHRQRDSVTQQTEQQQRTPQRKRNVVQQTEQQPKRAQQLAQKGQAEVEKQKYSYTPEAEKTKTGSIPVPEYRGRTQNETQSDSFMQTGNNKEFQYEVPTYRPRKERRQEEQEHVQQRRQPDVNYEVPTYRGRKEKQQQQQQQAQKRVHARQQERKQDTQHEVPSYRGRNEEQTEVEQRKQRPKRMQTSPSVQRQTVSTTERPNKGVQHKPSIDVANYMNESVQKQSVNKEHNFNNELADNRVNNARKTKMPQQEAIRQEQKEEQYADVSSTLQQYLGSVPSYKRKVNDYKEITDDLLHYLNTPVSSDKHVDKMNKRESNVISIRDSKNMNQSRSLGNVQMNHAEYLNRYNQDKDVATSKPKYSSEASNAYLKKYGINYNEN